MKLHLAKQASQSTREHAQRGFVQDVYDEVRQQRLTGTLFMVLHIFRAGLGILI